MKKPRIEQLVFTKVLEMSGVRRGLSEAETAPAIIGGWLAAPEPPSLAMTEEVGMQYTAAMMRTAVVFALPVEAFVEFFADGMPPPELANQDQVGRVSEAWNAPAVLPPLPYRRTWLEFGHEGAWIQGIYDEKGIALSNPGGEQFRVYGDPVGLTIEEVEVGKHWRIATFYYRPVEDDFVVGVADLKEGQIPNMFSDRMAIAGVHWLDALERYFHTVEIPRGHSRTHMRRFGFQHPTVYWVSLTGQGGKIVRQESDRHLTCRFMVRGHWVHWRQGRNAGTRSWRRSHIRGPEGAPFKGRPTYWEGEGA